MRKYFLLMVIALSFGVVNGQVLMQDDFEDYSEGTYNLPNAGEENCFSFKKCNDGVCSEKPLSISQDVALSGKKSLRFEFDKNNYILHHDGYCATRNEIRYETDIPFGSEAWLAFSVYPCLEKCNGTKYNSTGDTWICQIKNEKASGNRGGVQIRGDMFTTKKENGLQLGKVNYNAWNQVVVHVVYDSLANGGKREYWINGTKTEEPKDFNTSGGRIDFKLGCYGWHPEGKVVHFVDDVLIFKGKSTYAEIVGMINK